MHLRLPLVAGIVALAAGAAIVRPHLSMPASVRTPSLAMTTNRASDATADAAPSPAARSAASVASNRRRARNGVPPPAIVVYVAGEVRHPGLYRLPPRSRADDAVRAAGGARDDADLVALDLAAPIGDGDEVAVLAKSVAPVPSAHRRTRRAVPGGVRVADATATGARHKRRAHRKRRAAIDASTANDAPNDLIDLNHADASELETLPGIGAALAERIVTLREASGPFASADDLLDVGGMTQGRLDALSPYIVIR